MDRATLDYYAAPGRFTTVEAEADAASIREIVDLVQGLMVYDVAAQPFYGVDLTPEQADAIHERDSARYLAIAKAADARPLTEARPPAKRAGARCHAFSRMSVAFLRAARVPARARCGFATYFRPGWFEDHWVAEYWDAAENQWRMVDAQLDATWRKMLGFTGDLYAIGPTEFLTAGHAWQAWRRGELDADRCGLSAVQEHGSFWIGGNLRLDLASLNKVEMLPWDVWGSVWLPGEQPTTAQLELYDAIAELTVDPDVRFDELRSRYDNDDAVRMDGTVYNALRGSIEHV